MEYTKEILERVKNAGVLQYPIDKVVSFINPEDEAQFRSDISNPETILAFIYTEGLNQGQYKVDVALFKLQSAEAEIKTMEVNRQREVDKMVSFYLGEDIIQ